MINPGRTILILLVLISTFVKAKAQSPKKQEDTITTKTLDPVFVNITRKSTAFGGGNVLRAMPYV